jgi:hypothetical protein
MERENIEGGDYLPLQDSGDAKIEIKTAPTGGSKEKINPLVLAAVQQQEDYIPLWAKRNSEIPNNVNKKYKLLKVQLQNSHHSYHRELHNKTDWKEKITGKITELLVAGMFWDKPELQDELIGVGVIAASAAQIDEVAYSGFTLKESFEVVQVFGKSNYWFIILAPAAILQILPNFFAIKLNDFEPAIKPNCEVLFDTPRNKKKPAKIKLKSLAALTEGHTQFLNYALKLKAEEKDITTNGEYFLQACKYIFPALAAGYGNFSLSKGIFDNLWFSLSAGVLSGLATIPATYKGYTMNIIRFLNYWFTPVAFWVTNFLGTIAQLDSITALYDMTLINEWASPVLKLGVGLVTWYAIIKYAFSNSKAATPLKYLIGATWFLLAASPAILEFLISDKYGNLFALNINMKLAIQGVWLVTFVGPAGSSYYWLQVSGKTNESRVIYFTKENPQYLVYKRDILLGFEATDKYGLNVARRAAGMAPIARVIAEWSGHPGLISAAEAAEPFFLICAAQSTKDTRNRSADLANAPYKVKTFDGSVITVADNRLLDFVCPGDTKPARQMVKLSAWDNLFAVIKSLLINGIIAIALYMFVEARDPDGASSFIAGAAYLIIMGLFSIYSNRIGTHEVAIRSYIDTKLGIAETPISTGAKVAAVVTLGADALLRITTGGQMTQKLSFFSGFKSDKARVGCAILANTAPQVNETLFLTAGTYEECQETLEASEKPDAGFYPKLMGGIFGKNNYFKRVGRAIYGDSKPESPSPSIQ